MRAINFHKNQFHIELPTVKFHCPTCVSTLFPSRGPSCSFFYEYPYARITSLQRFLSDPSIAARHAFQLYFPHAPPYSSPDGYPFAHITWLQRFLPDSIIAGNHCLDKTLWEYELNWSRVATYQIGLIKIKYLLYYSGIV